MCSDKQHADRPAGQKRDWLDKVQILLLFFSSVVVAGLSVSMGYFQNCGETGIRKTPRRRQ